MLYYLCEKCYICHWKFVCFFCTTKVIIFTSQIKLLLFLNYFGHYWIMTSKKEKRGLDIWRKTK